MDPVVITRHNEESDFCQQPFGAKFDFFHHGQSISVRLDVFRFGCDVRQEEQRFVHPAPPFCRMFCFMPGPTGEIIIDGAIHSFAAETVYLLNAEHPFEVTYQKNSCLIFAHCKLSDIAGLPVFAGRPGLIAFGDAAEAICLRKKIAADDRFLVGSAIAYVLNHQIARELDQLAARHDLYLSFAPMLEWISRHPAGALRVSELAEAMGMSANHLSKYFKRRTGKSLKQYLQELYLQKAAELLLHTDLSTGEIAAKLGHDDAHYFYHAFKKLTGSSPGKYREINGYVI